MLDCLDDIDRILSSHEKFLLGVWLKDAKAMGYNQLVRRFEVNIMISEIKLQGKFIAGNPLQEKRNYERDARYQITLWGPEGEILDYANKQWSGKGEIQLKLFVSEENMARWSKKSNLSGHIDT